MTARAEILDREWLEMSLLMADDGNIQEATWKAFGCDELLLAAHAAAERFKNENLNDISLNSGISHWDILIDEIINKLKGTYKFPLEDEELCHCRKIAAKKVDESVVLGAHTPEKVRAWTSASSGCGTC